MPEILPWDNFLPKSGVKVEPPTMPDSAMALDRTVERGGLSGQSLNLEYFEIVNSGTVDLTIFNGEQSGMAQVINTLGYSPDLVVGTLNLSLLPNDKVTKFQLPYVSYLFADYPAASGQIVVNEVVSISQVNPQYVQFNAYLAAPLEADKSYRIKYFFLNKVKNS